MGKVRTMAVIRHNRQRALCSPYRAMRVKHSHFRPIERHTLCLFYERIYRPLFALLKDRRGITAMPPAPARSNAKAKDGASLSKAIESGRIRYIGGYFVGRLSAAVSRDIKELGGKWDGRKKAYRLDTSEMPPDIVIALSMAAERDRKTHEDILRLLDTMERPYRQNARPGIIKRITQKVIKTIGIGKRQNSGDSEDFQGMFEEVLRSLEENFLISLGNLAIAPEITPEMAAELARDYSDNMSLDIQNWEWQSIRRLREKVEKSAFAGLRAEDLAKVIMSDYGVSRSKATFLARQETGLLMSKYRETRYKSAGVRQYRWSTSGDGRVRESHAILDGNVYDWEHPPVVDPRTGRRAHPGEDYGCRCVAIPLIGDEEDDFAENSKQNDVEFESKHPRDWRGRFTDKAKEFKDGKEANEYFETSDSHKAWDKSITETEAEALYTYTDKAFAKYLNGELRKKKKDRKLDNSAKEKQAILDKLIRQYELKETIIVYRAMPLEFFHEKKGFYWDGAYFSSSCYKDAKVLQDYMKDGKKACFFTVEVPAGKGRGMYLNKYSKEKDSEYEFLIKRNARFKIISKEDTEFGLSVRVRMA